MKRNPALHVTGSVSRTLLGITFIFSGFVKALDPLGTTYKIEDYLGAFGGIMTTLTPLAEPMAWGLITFEFVLGVLLLTNVKSDVTSWLSFAMMLVMTPLTLWIALSNPVSDCGCFGDALVLTNWQTFWKNIVLLALVIVLLCTKRYIPQTFVWQAELGLTGIALLIVLCLMTYTRLHLPLKDFRPYKIGNNIPELMEIPDDATPDVYDIRLIYEKDGTEQEFSLQDYPKDDPSWHFVDQRSVLISKGYEPPIHDFVITNQDFEDLTYDILEDDREVILAILYKVEKTNIKQARRLNQMAQDAEQSGKPFYLLTGSGEEEIAAFREQTGYEQPVYSCDPVTLKTIVRANPGIVVLQQGTIIDKYNLRNR
ncbi:MAG: DoxX family protein [Paludibacteraceae bacterium]|nr:DoxX family protein [Paludibacteraceae bacterium]